MTAINTTTASTTTTDDTPAGFWRDTQGRLVPEDKVRDIDKTFDLPPGGRLDIDRRR